MSDAWYLDEHTQGSGPRPEYLRPKYKSLTDQARAYVELEKRFGEAPDNYDVTAYSETIDVENPHIKEFMGISKEHRITQDGFNKIINTFINYDKSTRPNIDDEIKKLGPEGMKKVDIINQWAKNNLSDDSYKEMERLPQTASMVNILDEIRQRMVKAMSNSPQQQSSEYKPVSEAEVRSEMRNNYNKYCNDAVYRQQIQDKLKLAMGTK